MVVESTSVLKNSLAKGCLLLMVPEHISILHQSVYNIQVFNVQRKSNCQKKSIFVLSVFITHFNFAKKKKTLLLLVYVVEAKAWGGEGVYI